MVEIEVYSTVGASEVSCSSLAEILSESVAKVWGKSVVTAEEWAKSEGKDVVKMVAFCTLQNSYARLKWNFGIMLTKGR